MKKIEKKKDKFLKEKNILKKFFFYNNNIDKISKEIYSLSKVCFLNGNFIKLSLLKKIIIIKWYEMIKYEIKIKNKNCIILPCFLNLIINVYDGKKFIKIKVFKDFIGHKVGELILTRKLGIHKRNLKAKRKRKNKINENKHQLFIKSNFNYNKTYLKEKNLKSIFFNKFKFIKKNLEI